MVQKVIFLFENCLPISAWIKKKRNLSLWKFKKRWEGKQRKNILVNTKITKIIHVNIFCLCIVGNYKIIYLKITFEASFIKINWTICKNLGPLEVVVYDKYCVTISVTVMAFYLMVFYENLYLLGMKYQISLYNLLLNH